VDVRKCLWIDGHGCKVMLQKQAAPLAAKWLRESDDNVLAHDYMRQLKHHLLAVRDDGCDNSPFIYDDDDEEMPLVVFLQVSPNRGSIFLLHMMLMLGEFDTELNLRAAGSMKDSLAMAKLFYDEDLLSQRVGIDLLNDSNEENGFESQRGEQLYCEQQSSHICPKDELRITRRTRVEGNVCLSAAG